MAKAVTVYGKLLYLREGPVALTVLLTRSYLLALSGALSLPLYYPGAALFMLS